MIDHHHALLGIAIPAYKRTHLLDRLLASIQTRFPVIVSDNGGHLPDVFKKNHSLVHFVSGHEVAMLENWNRAASAVQSSQWIVMPGDDDLYYPESFVTIERVIRENPSADIILFGHNIIDEHDQVTDTWQPSALQLQPPDGFDRVKLGLMARPPSIIFKSSLYKRLGGFCEQFKLTAGDNDFYQRVCLIGHTVFAPEIVSGYRVWASGGTAQTIATKEWLQDIDLWCNRMREFAAIHTKYPYTKALADQVYMANLRSGIKALKGQRQHLSAWRHLLANRYPYRATPWSQAKLFAQLLTPQFK
jgi:hypothetical protein